jgi:hypothetical protein
MFSGLVVEVYELWIFELQDDLNIEMTVSVIYVSYT